MESGLAVEGLGMQPHQSGCWEQMEWNRYGRETRPSESRSTVKQKSNCCSRKSHMNWLNRPFNQKVLYVLSETQW